MINILSIGEKLTEIIKDAFGVNLTELIINLIATILLILIVKYFFWNHVTAFLNKKKEKVKEEFEASEELRNDAVKIKEDALNELKESKEKASLIISDATKQAESLKEQIIEDAKKDASEIVSKSRSIALEEKEEILKSAKNELVDIASLMASKIIDEEIDNKRYNDKILDKIDEEDK